METNKKNELIKVFENTNIRTKWNAEEEDYYFSVVDVIEALTESKNPRNYWSMLKKRLQNEEKSELYTNCVRLKLESKDGKLRETDTLNTKGILRLIQSVPSPKAEPFKIWLAEVGKDRIDETFDPAKAVDRAISIYKAQGYNDAWIEKRLKGILHRNQLTDIWKSGGINEPIEYGILTNEIYKSWSGIKAQEYKVFKGIHKESLRDNMSDLEVLLTDIGETATKELAKQYNPQGLEQNKMIAKRGGNIAKNTRDNLEKELARSVITPENNLNIRYIDETQEKKIETK